ncbi:MAG: hypothetical protein ACR2K1_14825, partial [Saprospiraceae bacterium]
MDFQIVAFADKLKQVYTILTGDRVQDSPDWKNGLAPGLDMTRREALQKIGTECLRDNLHNDVWVRALFADLEPGRNYIISDVRFPNEAKAILDAGGKVVRVVRHGFNNGIPQHESETALDSWYFDTIHNATFSMNFLQEQVWLLAYSN